MLQSLTSLILSSSSVTSLVPSENIVWKKLHARDSWPRIVLHTVSSTPQYHMTGPSGLSVTRVQADCLGETYSSARAVAQALETLLSSYYGTYGTTKFDGIFIDSVRDALEDDDTPDTIFGVSIDLMIWHKEN